MTQTASNPFLVYNTTNKGRRRQLPVSGVLRSAHLFEPHPDSRQRYVHSISDVQCGSSSGGIGINRTRLISCHHFVISNRKARTRFVTTDPFVQSRTNQKTACHISVCTKCATLPGSSPSSPAGVAGCIPLASPPDYDRNCLGGSGSTCFLGLEASGPVGMISPVFSSSPRKYSIVLVMP